jgi:DNA-binding CsgD family transcriptional regulator
MRGVTSKETARQMQITNDTVHDHLKAIYRKTGAQGRGHLQHQLALDVWRSALYAARMADIRAA